MTSDSALATAVLGGGCFWCLDAVFRELDGVGRSNPATPAAETPIRRTKRSAAATPGTPRSCASRSIRRVIVSATCCACSSRSTTRRRSNRQGNDVGTQYRSVIFCETPEQRADAEAVIAELTAQRLWRDPVVTEIAGPATFYPAETYHQDYFERNGGQPYCAYVVAPKVAKFRKAFANRLKRRAQRR